MNSRSNDQIPLQAATIEAIAEGYPEPLRKPFLWLASYVRNQCSRDIVTLTTRADKLGIEFDKTTWSKILRGRYNRDAEGELMEHSVVALPKLLAAIEALRRDWDRQEGVGAIAFVEIRSATAMWHYIDRIRADGRVCKFGVIIGATGSGKTASAREYQRREAPYSVAWTDAPQTPTLGQFLSDLGACYGIPRTYSFARKLNAIRDNVNETRCIIVENVQRLYDVARGGNQPLFSYLQKLQEETGCTIIFSFTPTFERAMLEGIERGFFEQFEGRAGGRQSFFRLPEYPLKKDVLKIAEAFGLRSADEHIEMLQAISRQPGRIRILFDVLQEAKRKATKKGVPLTMNWIDDVLRDRRVNIEEEAA